MVDKKFGAEVEFTADTADLEKLNAELQDSKDQIEKLTKEYQDLKKASALTQTFKNQKQALEESKSSTTSLKDETQKLAIEISKTEKPTQAQTRQLETLRKRTRAAADAEKAQAAELQKTRKALLDAGIETNKLAVNELRLKRSLEATNKSLTSAKKSHSQLAAEIVKANKQAKAFAATNATAGASLKGYALQAAGAATVAGALVLALGASVRESIRFEKALVAVRKTSSGTREQFRQLRNDIEQLSVASGTSANDLAEIAAAGGRLGVGIENLTEFTRLANVMSVAFDVAAENAGTAIGTLSNVFDIPINQIGELVDVINVLGNNTNATEAQITEALQRIGGTAKGFGLAAENAAALVDALIAMGEPPETAAVALSGMLAKLQNINVAGARSKAALDSIGLSASELADRIQADPQKALDGFLQTLSELDSRQASEVINQIFGEEQARKVVKLVGNLDQYKKALELVSDESLTAGAAQREFDAALQSTDAQAERAGKAISSIARDVGDFFIPAIKIAAEGIADFVGSLRRGEEQITPFTKAVSNITGAVTGLGTFLGETAAKIAIFTGGLKPANVDKFKTSAQQAKDEIKDIGDQAEVAATKLGGGFSTSLVAVSALGKKVKQSVVETAQALKILNVDAGLVSTGVRASFDTMIASYNQLSNELNNFEQISGEQSLRLIDQAQSVKELEAANLALFQSFQLGTLSATDFKTAIDESNRKLAELDPATAKIRDNLSKIGLDYDLLAGKASKSTSAQVRALGDLLAQTAKIPGASEQVVAAFEKQVKSQQDAALFLAEIDRLEKQQVLTAQQAANARDRITAALGEFATVSDKALLSIVAEAESIDKLNASLAEAQQRYDQGGLSADQFADIEQAASERRIEIIAREDTARQASATRQRAHAAEQRAQAAQAQQQLVEYTKSSAQFAQQANQRHVGIASVGGELNKILGNIYKSVTDLGKPAEDQLARMSEGFRMMRDEGVNAFSSLETAQYRLASAQDALRTSASGLTEILAKEAIIAAQVSIEYETQKQQLETLERRVESAGNTSEQYIRHLEGVKNNLTLLNESDLSGINSAIDTARDKVQQLEQQAQSARDALAGIGDSLQDELDRLDNNQEAIEQRRYQEQLQNIARLEAEGGESARREAEQSRKLAEQLHRRKLEQIREQERERKQRESAQNSGDDQRSNQGRTSGNSGSNISSSNNSGGNSGSNNQQIGNVSVDTTALTNAVKQVASRPIEVIIDGRVVATALQDIDELSQ